MPDNTTLKNPQYYIGSSEWEGEEWVGNFYPANTKRKDMLELYSNQCNFTELKAPYLKPDAKQLNTWLRAVNGKNFKFGIWLPKEFFALPTPSLQEEAILNYFEECDSIENFFPNVGPLFLTITKTYSKSTRNKLFNLINSSSKIPQYFINVHDNSWRTKEVLTELIDYANKNHVGVVIDNINLLDLITNGRVYYRYDVADSFDVNVFRGKLKNNIEEVYICVTGKDKMFVMQRIKELQRYFRNVQLFS